MRGNIANLKRGDKLDANRQSHNWNIHNGRQFGKRYGRKGGKARWASMTQEEKDFVTARRVYFAKQASKLRVKLSKTALTTSKMVNSQQDIKDIEEFFGDII